MKKHGTTHRLASQIDLVEVHAIACLHWLSADHLATDALSLLVYRLSTYQLANRVAEEALHCHSPLKLHLAYFLHRRCQSANSGLTHWSA